MRCGNFTHQTLADPYTQLPSITFWLLGGLSTITLHDLWFSAPLIFAGLVPLLLLRWRMNLLTLSDDEARSLGINVSRLRLGLIVCATLITACTVAIAGIIGWIGLVVPHIGRLLSGNNHQQLLPVSMGVGAILLLLTDTLARTLSSTEIPLGILTAFIGAPFFLLLLLRGNSPMTLLTLRHASLGYHSHQPVLRDVSFQVSPGSVCCLIGDQRQWKNPP